MVYLSACIVVGLFGGVLVFPWLERAFYHVTRPLTIPSPWVRPGERDGWGLVILCWFLMVLNFVERWNHDAFLLGCVAGFLAIFFWFQQFGRVSS